MAFFSSFPSLAGPQRGTVPQREKLLGINFSGIDQSSAAII